MPIIPGNAQHIGSRLEQQDDFGFTDTENVTFVDHGGVLAIITDGMGGLSQGREASLLAKITMLANYEQKSVDETIPQRLLDSLLAANAKVVEMAEHAGLVGQIGTTLAAAVVRNTELYWIAVGDSHIYLYRQGKIKQLNADHDYARHLALAVAQGKISQEDAAAHPQRHALTSYLGLVELEEIEGNETPVVLEPGDQILLCSDGLYKTIAEQEIVSVLDQHPQAAAERLIDLTLAREKLHQDNVTVAILAFEAEPGSNQTVSLFPGPKKIVVLGAILLCLVSAWGASKYFSKISGWIEKKAPPPAVVQPGKNLADNSPAQAIAPGATTASPHSPDQPAQYHSSNSPAQLPAPEKTLVSQKVTGSTPQPENPEKIQRKKKKSLQHHKKKGKQETPQKQI
jgi:serine/threonine protein phosphatase PrpC